MIDIHQRDKIDIRDKKITVLGLGRSGFSVAKLAHFLGGNVFASDPGTTKAITANIKSLDELGVRCESGAHTDLIYDADLWVISPGIPKEADIILKALSRNISVVGEIEFTSWFTDEPIIAVTGSNGKTTTVHALTEMCKTPDVYPKLAGNMGIPFSQVVLEDLIDTTDNNRLYILEISSFQMEFILHFKPTISVFLNLSPDHLDRYADMDDYVNAKMNLYINQTEDEILIYYEDDPILCEKISKATAKKLPFSLKNSSLSPFNVIGDKILDENQTTLIDIKNIKLPGNHNLLNLIAAANAAYFAGIPNEFISAAMRNFSGVPHRLESVATISGVKYINDSKATNIDAVCVAVASFQEPMVLILGGKFKGGNFLEILHYAKNLKTVIAYGQANEIIATALRDAVSLTKVVSLKDAVEISYSITQPGDVVLLSPGCSSFDQFSDFEDRGNQFKTWVKQLETN